MNRIAISSSPFNIAVEFAYGGEGNGSGGMTTTFDGKFWVLME
jgi:hypothetical protein